MPLEDWFGVSRETTEALRHYERLLLKWQGAINLVGPATCDDVWQRHILDSLQLLPLLGGGKVVYDFGSGAGFPGLVLAIARPDLDVYLVEADAKKCAFLRTVSRETGAAVSVVQARIEAFTDGPAPDIVTARALASLGALLAYVAPFAAHNQSLRCLFLKGATLEDEVEEARDRYVFDFRRHPSQTDPQGAIAEIVNIQTK